MNALASALHTHYACQDFHYCNSVVGNTCSLWGIDHAQTMHRGRLWRIHFIGVLEMLSNGTTTCKGNLTTSLTKPSKQQMRPSQLLGLLDLSHLHCPTHTLPLESNWRTLQCPSWVSSSGVSKVEATRNWHPYVISLVSAKPHKNWPSRNFFFFESAKVS